LGVRPEDRRRTPLRGGTLLERELLADDRSVRVGAIYRMDFNEAVVLTHDKWKLDAGGIPQYSFLLATARDVTDEYERAA
jgi:hypothetical protein